MQGFAGVVVFRQNAVLMVNEPNYFTLEPTWTFPSGKIDAGETPVEAAARELAEESGCLVDAASLVLVAVADVWQGGTLMSRSWNYSAETTTTATLSPRAREGEIVTDASWFEQSDVIDLLGESNYPPKAVPARHFLTTGEGPLHWAFDLIDSSTTVPTFRWGEPVRQH
ncbi:NUDIX domain-containing protein [Propionibacteriaceae bacterium Y1685]|uniref:NUDIX domain-containing protein n=1 Tax=Microlunatus sp. Y1700 TaxID=3418487 RepID=UPI003B7CCE92